MSLARGGANVASVLDRATAELVYSLSVEASEWTPKRYGYRVGSLAFLVGEKTRSEVVRAPAVAALPHTPAWLLGLINLRGNLVAVTDLRALCGEPSTGKPAQVLVLESGGTPVAIPIDGLPVALAELRELPELPSLPDALAEYVGAACEGQGETWLAFDHDAFFRAQALGAGIRS